METQIKTSGGAKDFFINLSAVVALYALVGSLLNLLFTVINTKYPQINNYSYFGSSSISWPVATLIIFFPVFILLMWLLEKEYKVEPELQNRGIHRWLTWITLFVAGLTIAGDLITVIYYFIDGEELTAGFLLKVLTVLVVAACVFAYYISDVLGKLTAQSRKIWRVIALVLVLGSIILGFVVLGSPRTQRLYKYDEQKVNHLQSINGQIQNYYYNKGVLPGTLQDMANGSYYISEVDPQNQKPYEYKKTSDTTYELCAEFNKASDDKTLKTSNNYYDSYGSMTWTHSVGNYCFSKSVKVSDIYR